MTTLHLFSFDRIEEAALMLVWEEGYSALTLNRLAQRMAVDPRYLASYAEILELESRVLERLALQIPLPPNTVEPITRGDLETYLIELRGLAIKVPLVLHPPADSAAEAIFLETLAWWDLTLQECIPDEEYARLVHDALLAYVESDALKLREYGLSRHERRTGFPAILYEGVSHLDIKQYERMKDQDEKEVRQRLAILIDILMPGLGIISQSIVAGNDEVY